MCKEAQAPAYADNLDFVIAAMEALGRTHTITRAFLRQVVVDVERNGVSNFVRLPRLDSLGDDFNAQVSHNIPLVARSSISRHSEVQPPLPGRLPLGRPVGKVISDEFGCDYGTWVSETSLFDSYSPETQDLSGNQHKRKRTTPFGVPATTSTNMDASSESSDRFWAGVQDHVSTNPSTHSSPTNPLGAMAAAKAASIAHPVSCGASYSQVSLPHRTGSPSLNANANINANTNTSNTNTNAEPTSAPQDSNVRLGVGIASAMLGNMGRAPLRTAGRGEPSRSHPAAATSGLGDWEVAGLCMHNQFAANGPGAAFPDPAELDQQQQQDGLADDIPWSMAGCEGMNAVDWDAIGASFGIEPGGVAGGAEGNGGGGIG